MTWYYVNNGEAAGPISDEELLSRLRLGSILPTTLVWRSGMSEWQAASKIVATISVRQPVLEPTAASTPSAYVDAPPELTSGTPPVLPHFFCTYCGAIIPADQLVRIGGRNVCAACKPIYVQKVSEGLDAPVKAPVIGNVPATFAVTPENDLADPFLRLVGYILDLLFIGVPLMIVYLIVVALGMTVIISKNPGAGAAVGFGAIIMAFIGFAFFWVFFYWTFFIGKTGATPGMKIMKIKMVRADRTRVSYGQAFGRALLLYVVNAFTMGLTNITAFFDREKRTVVDMICQTRVVRNDT